MRTKRGRRLAVAVLLGAGVLLALIDLHLLRTPIETAPIAPPSGRAGASPAQLPEPATPLDGKTARQFRETVSRPLFNPDRRPVERGKKAAPARPKAAPVTVRLVGVVKEADGPPRALIRLGDAPRGKWVAEGAKLEGWTLAKVNDASVILETDGRSREVKLFIPRPPAEKAGQNGSRPNAGPGGARPASRGPPAGARQARPSPASSRQR